jgi:hygromycin-B 7''-O-kinase
MNWQERVQLYKLYHALELWDWFAAVGNKATVVRPTDDLWRFAAA